jgi:hypothetical protein
MNIAQIKHARTSELVDFYNSKHPEKPIKKFVDRATAEKRIITLIKTTVPQEKIPNKKEGKRDTVNNRKIVLLIKHNPKNPKSLSYGKFELLLAHDGKTVGEFKSLEGKYPQFDTEKGWGATTLRWSVDVGHIKLVKE